MFQGPAHDTPPNYPIPHHPFRRLRIPPAASALPRQLRADPPLHSLLAIPPVFPMRLHQPPKAPTFSGNSLRNWFPVLSRLTNPRFRAGLLSRDVQARQTMQLWAVIDAAVDGSEACLEHRLCDLTLLEDRAAPAKHPRKHRVEHLRGLRTLVGQSLGEAHIDTARVQGCVYLFDDGIQAGPHQGEARPDEIVSLSDGVLEVVPMRLKTTHVEGC